MSSKTSSFGTTSRSGHDSGRFYGRKLYADERNQSGQSGAQAPAAENAPPELNIIYNEDSRNMSALPDGSVHLMITSPPYNVGKDYDDDLSLTEYRELLAGVMSETFRVLTDGGRACINIANIGRSPYIPLHALVIEIAAACGFLMRGEIIWDKGASAGSSCAWGSWQSASNPTLRDVHEYILIFSRGRYARHPVKENSIGRDAFLESTKSIWRFPAVSAKRVGHPAPFPVELPLRLIHLYSYVGDIILDPFMGSGSTALASLQTGRHYIGYEVDPAYITLTRERIWADSPLF